MTKAKYIITIITTILILFLANSVVNAADTQTATSTINGVTANWSYTLNESNQIENLKCTNASDLTGNITTPAELDGKAVVAIGNEAFKSAVNITGVTISSSTKKLGYGAFNGCTSLNNVNLGNIVDLSFDTFKGCTSLTTIKIPKTLTNGAVSPCLNNMNITNITLEEGLTVVPSYLCANTGITSITLPSSVKSIGYDAFANCTNLNNIDLGSITDLSFDIFKGCTSLTSVKIPKTLTNGSVSPCFNNTNITSITLEEGLKVVPTYLCANTGITSITIPNSVESIGYDAFSNCAELTNVNLGNTKSISFDTFKNCPKLSNIVIPKTLTDGTTVDTGVFTGTTNLTSVTFEEGLTEIPAGILQGCSGITSVTIPDSVTKINCYAFTGTNISEITIPNNVTEIQYYAFKDCSKLNKITILDNCTHIGWFTLYTTQDTVFNNHNSELTIYCYEGSKIAEYAIGTNIKYVYLTRPKTETPVPEEKEPAKEESTTPETSTPGKTEPSNNDETIASGKLPYTGQEIGIFIISISIILVGGTFAYFKYNRLKDI